MSKKVVIDTSVLISALLGPKGPAREVIRLCFESKYTPLMGNALFSEYTEVSNRAAIRGKCVLTNKELEKLLNSFFSISIWTPIYYLWRPNLKDEYDNHLIELAVAGNAEIIVTNNIKDFGNSELYFPQLSIVTPAQLLRGI